jgi:formylglycine-generating enzyme required for sulfatase activity
MTFVRIPAGEFRMGSTDGHADERPVHTVRISQPFYLGIHAVTQGQWEAAMGNNPSRFTGDPNRPVERVSWEDVQEFIGRLNAREGHTLYRLPTEAEWEYAARAGSTTAYCFGDDSHRLGEYAWYSENAGRQTHPVGTLQPNAWGLYDMHGNVWEWVQDWYGKYAAEPVTDPQGPALGSARVYRGGSWSYGAGYCRSAYRRHDAPGYRYGGLGFRLLRTAP